MQDLELESESKPIKFSYMSLYLVTEAGRQLQLFSEAYTTILVGVALDKCTA